MKSKRGGRRLFLPALLISLFSLSVLCGACASSGYSQKPDSVKDKGEMAGIKHETHGPVTYVALGDSTGVGVGAREGGYVARLFKRIERERPGSRLKNLCVSGSTTEDVLREQVAPATRAGATLITLAIGINDIGHQVSADQFARSYEEIVKRLRSATEAPIVVVTLPDVSLAPVIPPYLREAAHNQVLLYNQKIREIADRQHLIIVDAYAETRDSIEAHPEFFSSDGFHPSDIGYEYWAKTMWPSVKEALGN